MLAHILCEHTQGAYNARAAQFTGRKFSLCNNENWGEHNTAFNADCAQLTPLFMTPHCDYDFLLLEGAR